MFHKKSYLVTPITVKALDSKGSKTFDDNIQEEPLPGKNVKKGLSRAKKIIFGFGNVLNELCATLWFTYFLVYLDYVVRLNSTLAGYLMLTGQITSALATIIFGCVADKTFTSIRYGNRKIWHLIGSIMVGVFFPFLLNVCILCKMTSDSENGWTAFSYYFVFVAIYQTGWAINHVTHLALIPQLATTPTERVELSSVRYAFKVLSSVVLYGIKFVLLDQGGSDSKKINPEDHMIFTILSIVAVGAGAVFTIIFHIVIKEKRKDMPYNYSQKELIDDSLSDISSTHTEIPPSFLWQHWLKEHQFYLVGLINLTTRTVVIGSQVYMPFYVSSTLHMSKQFIAIIPLIIYVSSFITAIIIKPINKCLGLKITYIAGCLLVIASCVWMYFTSEAEPNHVIGAAILLGTGKSVMYVASQAIIANLIGEHSHTGGFVYGVMGFSEKAVLGGILALVSAFSPCNSSIDACEAFYRQVMVFVPGSSALLALVVLATLYPMEIGRLRHGQNTHEIVTIVKGESTTKSQTNDHSLVEKF